MSLVLYKSTTSKLGLIGLVDEDGSAVTNATVTASLTDTSGDELNGQSSPITLTHDSGGNYYGTLSEDLDVKAGKRYRVEITATSGNLQSVWRESVNCRYADSD